ncbi:MAG: signal peptidase I [Candidatus Gastranaerophilales bacterium]
MNKFKNKFYELKTRYEKINPVTREIIETIVFVVAMLIVIRFFIGEIRWIPSASMNPTLIEGDRVVVERFSRFYKTPERGDVMVFYPPFVELQNTPLKVFSRLTGFFCKDIAYIKRVVGMPGDKFEIVTEQDGKFSILINDEPIDEPYIKSPYDYRKCDENMICGPFTIPEKQYFMMGDNRGNSQDSRYWGFLDEDRFIGEAVFLFWPFNRAKIMK